MAALDRSHSPHTDEALMAMAQAQDHDALDLLHDRYAKLLKGLSMQVLHDDSDAEDLLQDVFIEIWERAASYDALKGRPLSWIATLTRRRSIDRLRKRETYRRAEERFAMEAGIHEGSWTHVHEDLMQSERHTHLTRAMAALPDAQRSAIRFAYHEQMTQRQIAAHTGIALGTIKMRLKLALRKLAVSLCGFEDLIYAGDRATRTETISSGDKANSGVGTMSW